LAVARARSGAGPSFLECRTFRWRGHVGANSDEDVGVRRRGELAAWVEHDPIRRAEDRLVDFGLAMNLEPNRAHVDQEIGRALAAARRAPRSDGRRTWEHVCAS